MEAPAEAAIVPLFMRFGIAGVEIHHEADPGRATTSIHADLVAEPGCRLMSEKAKLANCRGALNIWPETGLSEWSGSLLRGVHHFDRDTQKHESDYRIVIRQLPDEFDRMLSFFHGGFELIGLSIDNQGIPGPGDESEQWDDDMWDDVRFPHVRVSRYFLRWAKPGAASGTFEWPGSVIRR